MTLSELWTLALPALRVCAIGIPLLSALTFFFHAIGGPICRREHFIDTPGERIFIGMLFTLLFVCIASVLGILLWLCGSWTLLGLQRLGWIS